MKTKPGLLLFIIGILFLSELTAQTNINEIMKENSTYSFFVGTYTNRDSQGIYKYLLQKDGALKRIGLVALSDNPSFLAMSADNRFLVAVNEINHEGVGAIESFLVTGDSLAFISRSSSGGAHPCFVKVNETGFVLTDNYTGGNVGLLRLNNKGELSVLLDLQQHSGSGSTERQQEPHAHSAWFEPDGYSKPNTCADIHISSDGKFVYASNRGHNTIAIYEVNPGDGSLKLVGHQRTYGKVPRNFSLSPDDRYLIVANKSTNNIVSFKRDATTGLLEYVCQIEAP